MSNAPQPAVQDVNFTAAPSDLMQIAPSGSSNLSKHEITNCTISIDNPVVPITKAATSNIGLSKVSCSNSQAATLSAALSKFPPTNLAAHWRVVVCLRTQQRHGDVNARTSDDLTHGRGGSHDHASKIPRPYFSQFHIIPSRVAQAKCDILLLPMRFLAP
nr:hypothetical protein Iba_chr01aCG5280 [Ipomoea batatas]